jgi:hypothetical protein
MEGSCSTGQNPQWAVVPVEEEEEECRLLRNMDLTLVVVCIRVRHMFPDEKPVYCS